MPLSNTSNKVMKNMQDQYGSKKGKQVFYATANKKGGPAEEEKTWKSKRKKAASAALGGILMKVAGIKTANDTLAALAPYLPYVLGGGAIGAMTGDEETPWWQRAMLGAGLGGLAGYGVNNYLSRRQQAPTQAPTQSDKENARARLNNILTAPTGEGAPPLTPYRPGFGPGQGQAPYAPGVDPAAVQSEIKRQEIEKRRNNLFKFLRKGKS